MPFIFGKPVKPNKPNKPIKNNNDDDADDLLLILLILLLFVFLLKPIRPFFFSRRGRGARVLLVVSKGSGDWTCAEEGVRTTSVK